MNPGYDSDQLGWEKISVEFGDNAYEFNTLCFWKTKTGEVYMAHDSGCSCPVPFKSFEGKTEKAITQKLERVGSLEQAKAEFERHHEDEYDRPNTQWVDLVGKLKAWGLK